MDLHRALGSLGFTERELDVYLSLYTSGPASIRDIAKKANYNRGSTYEVLKELQRKGVVSYFPKGKRRYFTAEEPEGFLRLAEEKRDAIDGTIASLKQEIIPDLLLRKPEFNTATVHYYEGDDGIEFVLKDLLTTVSSTKSKEYYVYSSKPIRKYLYRPFPTFTKQRIKKGITVKVIAIGEGGEETELSERKWIPTNRAKTAASYIAVYPPKYASISLAHEDYPAAVVIDSEEIAEVQKIIFQTLWDLL